MYRYTLMENPEAPSQTFSDKKTMRKHLALNMPGTIKVDGLIVDANGASYFFDDLTQLESYLDIEEE